MTQIVIIVVIVVAILWFCMRSNETFLPEDQQFCQKVCIGMLKSCHKPPCVCVNDFNRCENACGLR